MLQAETDFNGSVSAIEVDVTIDYSVFLAAQKIAADYGRLDILVNNSSIVSMANPPSRDANRNIQYTNLVGDISITEALLDRLRMSEEPRLVFVSSCAGSISQAADPSYQHYSSNDIGYRSSMAALRMMITVYRIRLENEGFKIHGADPGLCATHSTENAQSLLDNRIVTPAEAGQRVASVVKGEWDNFVGRVLGEDEISPW
ncbi:Short-chain dehydrogenase/reductase SDR [Penicillium brevicompactum]|uniref:Short-chain dehydrogenase/reductase SDR n=1 Tax=Penicillium brevicompactum TaxID=5074 RepID=UPI0025416C3C|nr:Short-chain dehydrogenase/reductase SDR [Penicillium brevicompactum]KAJ5336747.1 Short-chain dehydrogenase/reductase SDR [Penicillium brevicompactum]